MKKPKHPAVALFWLILIPAQIILDVVMITLGAYADTAIANPEAHGHPAPAVVLLATFIAVVFTVIVPLFSVIITIVRYNILKKRYKNFLYQNQTYIQ
ncbi:MAG: hypothetical protein J5518_03250 [Lachnospiraceae bacterium]|nr:hypothetical protein [Lachnospiraceae bacterium]